MQQSQLHGNPNHYLVSSDPTQSSGNINQNYQKKQNYFKGAIHQNKDWHITLYNKIKQISTGRRKPSRILDRSFRRITTPIQNRKNGRFPCYVACSTRSVYHELEYHCSMVLRPFLSSLSQASATCTCTRVIHGNPVHNNRDPADLAELYYTISDCIVTLQSLNCVNDLYGTDVISQAIVKDYLNTCSRSGLNRSANPKNKQLLRK